MNNFRNIKKQIDDVNWANYRLAGSDRAVTPPYHFRKGEQPCHEWDFEPGEHEPQICTTFGCGRTLTLRESLFGSICAHCQPEKPLMQGKSPQDEKRALMELKMRLMRF